ncbi:MAG TPA: nidogen-like domain-containing protein [Caldimonas sp.]|jgi:hypothetical protein
MLNIGRRTLFSLAALAAFASVPAQAQLVVPQSALTPSGQYYTDLIGGGIGSVVVMTGGGNDPGIGLASGRNDDGFSGPINLGFTLNFFGTNYTQFFANNNGNISFGAGISEFIPTGPTGATSPVISPYFADVDTRGGASGVLHIRNDIANEVILTWDSVGYFDEHTDKLNSFQLVVRGPSFAIPNGEGAIGFFYKNMPWIGTDTSTTAAVGFGNGAGGFEVLEGSNTATINTAIANHDIWFGQNLVVVPPPVPEPETYALFLAGLGTLGVIARRRRPQA